MVQTNDSPLQPDNISMPTTCDPNQSQAHLTFRPNHSTFPFPHNDWIMYVLFYQDIQLLRQIIASAVTHMRSTHAQYPHVLASLDAFTPNGDDSITRLRAKMLVLLDTSTDARTQLATFRSDTIRELRSPCPLKASNFFEVLHTQLIPSWLQDETVSILDLVESARDAYLIA